MPLPSRHTTGRCGGLHAHYTATRHEPWGWLVVDKTTAAGGVRHRRHLPPLPQQPRANTPPGSALAAHKTTPHFSSMLARVRTLRGGRCVPPGRRTSPSAASIRHPTERGCPPCPSVSSRAAPPHLKQPHSTPNTPTAPRSSQTQVRARGICDLHGRTPQVSTPILARTGPPAHPDNSWIGPEGGQRHQPGKSRLSRSRRRAGHLIHEAPSRSFVAPKHARAWRTGLSGERAWRPEWSGKQDAPMSEGYFEHRRV